MLRASLSFMVAMFAVLSVFFTPIIALAQEAVETVTESIPVVTNDEFINLLVTSIGGIKGASTLAIVLIVVKLLAKFLSTEWAGKLFKKLSDRAKFTIITGLNVVIALLGLMTVGGLSFGAAIVHSTVIAALSVFLNQGYKVYFGSKSTT